MFARLTAKAILAAAAIAMAFFGVGLLGMALASALVATLGVGGRLCRGRRDLAGAAAALGHRHASVTSAQTAAAPVNNELTRVLLAAVAKETPWIAIIGAGLASAANMFLNRNKSPK